MGGGGGCKYPEDTPSHCGRGFHCCSLGVGDKRENFLKIMPSTVQSLKVTYNNDSEKNAFTNGDTVTGQVTLEVTKDCKAESLYVKFKGKAEVLWTERHGQTTVTYHSKDKYFSITHYFIREEYATADNQSLLTNQYGQTYGNLLATGTHVFPFTFQFPLQEMPSSFTGSVGKIVYLLETKLNRSMRIRTKDTIKIPFVTQVVPTMMQEIMTPQHDSKDKKLHLLNSGTVAMDVKIEKSGFIQGEGLKVVATIQNNSTREIKPKYCIYRKHSFFARGKRRLDTKDLLKDVGDPIPPSASQTVERVITIPHDLEPSILNCSILKAEYRVRVYLDVKYASDPEIKFPILILGALTAPTVAASLPSTESDFGPFGYQNPAAWGTFSQPQSYDPPPPYEAYGMYPSLMDNGGKP
ncbi:arrestin domain-containing protein 3-like isoform 2-T2 [Syngnathus typhle]